MKFGETASYCLIMAACAGCPGTIDDPSIFEKFGQPSSQNDAGDADSSLPGDAGSSEEAGLDASGSLEDSGGTTLDGDISNDGDSAPSDASAEDGGAPPEDAGTGADADIGCDFAALIDLKCKRCHSAPVLTNTLDLLSPDLAGRIGTTQGTGGCSSYQIIDTAQPERSALYLQVTAEACGSRMPLNGTLTDGEQACILRWIQSL
jgi:hypothetical protein